MWTRADTLNNCVLPFKNTLTSYKQMFLSDLPSPSYSPTYNQHSSSELVQPYPEQCLKWLNLTDTYFHIIHRMHGIVTSITL